MDLNISENKDKKRFEVHVGDGCAFIDYIRAEDKMYLTHTEVPSEMEGNGIGSALVKHALAAIEGENRKLVPLCPFVASYIKRHPEYAHLLAVGYSV